MIPSNFEIDVEKKEALQKPELWKSRSCLKYLRVCLENQMPYALFASEEKLCFLLEYIAYTGVWYRVSRGTRMFGFGVGGVNLVKVIWREDGENRMKQVGKKEVGFLAIFANWVELLELEITS